MKTDAEAKAIIAGLDAGKPFSSFVSRSIDANSKRDGGSLGWTDLAGLSPSYAHAIAELKTGAHNSKPLAESYGYGVIKVEDQRQDSFPSYADARNDLIEHVKKQWQAGLLKALRDKATIEVFEGYENKVIDLRNRK
ncbi:putative parvulin-type peptidyl-prolyl cis-trans isomerase precursor [compost metagenome]